MIGIMSTLLVCIPSIENSTSRAHYAKQDVLDGGGAKID